MGAGTYSKEGGGSGKWTLCLVLSAHLDGATCGMMQGRVLSEDEGNKGAVTAGRSVTSAPRETQGQTNKHRRVLERERSKCLWLINGNNFLSFNF